MVCQTVEIGVLKIFNHVLKNVNRADILIKIINKIMKYLGNYIQ